MRNKRSCGRYFAAAPFLLRMDQASDRLDGDADRCIGVVDNRIVKPGFFPFLIRHYEETGADSYMQAAGGDEQGGGFHLGGKTA